MLTLPLTNDKVILTDIKKDTHITAEAEKIVYNFDDNSKNVTYKIGRDIRLSLRIIDTGADNFENVYINDTLLDPKFYDIETEALIVNIKDKYLKTLKNGNYSIKVSTKDGAQAATGFVIANSPVGLKNNPKTGDNLTYYVLSAALMIGLAGCVLYAAVKKKHGLY